MLDEQRSWRIAWWGITLKLVAAYGLILAVIVFGLLVGLFSQLPIPLATYLLLPILLLDFVGRLACLAAPVPGRQSLYVSFIVQGLGLIAMVVPASVDIGLDDPAEYGVLCTLHILGFLAAIICQAIAAKLFTSFLKALAIRLGREDLVPQVNSLDVRLTATMVSGKILLIGALLALLLSVILCCGSFLIPVPPGPYLYTVAAVLFPAALACLIFYTGTYISYHSNLRQVRNAIADQGWKPSS